MNDTSSNVLSRKRIAGIVLDIHSSPEGCTLHHGYGNDTTEFRNIDTVWIAGIAHAVMKAYNGRLIGVIVRAPGIRDRWILSNGDYDTPPVFIGSMVSRYSVEDFAAAGPVIVIGTVIRDEEGNLVEPRTIETAIPPRGRFFLEPHQGGESQDCYSFWRTFRTTTFHEDLVPLLRGAKTQDVGVQLGLLRGGVLQNVRQALGVSP